MGAKQHQSPSQPIRDGLSHDTPKLRAHAPEVPPDDDRRDAQEYETPSIPIRDGLQPDAKKQAADITLERVPAGMHRLNVAAETPAQHAARVAGRKVPQAPPYFSKVRFDPGEAVQKVWGIADAGGAQVVDHSDVLRFDASGAVPHSMLSEWAKGVDLDALADAANIDRIDLDEYLQGDIPSDREKKRIARNLPGAPSVDQVWPLTLNGQRVTDAPGGDVQEATNGGNPAIARPGIASEVRAGAEQRREQRNADDARAAVARFQSDLELADAKEGVRGLGAKLDRIRGR